MYKSKIAISTKWRIILINFLNKFLKTNNKIYCRAFKRKISLNKLPEAIINRKSSVTQRLQKFWVAVEILKHEKNYKKNPENEKEFEIIWFDKNNKKVIIHIREEKTLKKDKILYFVSCF